MSIHYSSVLTKISVGKILITRITTPETRTLIHEVAMLPCPNAMEALRVHGGVKAHNTCGVCVVCKCKEAHSEFYRGVRGTSNG